MEKTKKKEAGFKSTMAITIFYLKKVLFMLKKPRGSEGGEVY